MSRSLLLFAMLAVADVPDLRADLSEPGAAVAADPDATFRTLFGQPTGTRVQSVPRRAVPDAVALEGSADHLADDRVAGEDGVPVTQAVLSSDRMTWGFVLAGGELVAAEIAPTYRLLDALDVQTNPGGFPSFETMWLARHRPAVLVTNAHFNSQEGFAQQTIVALVDGQLRPVWDGPLLYSVQTGDDACDVRRIEQLPSTFRLASDTEGDWPDLHVGFRELASCEKDGTTRESPPSTLYTATLRWDAGAGRYVGTLADLEALNARRRGLDDQ